MPANEKPRNLRIDLAGLLQEAFDIAAGIAGVEVVDDLQRVAGQGIADLKVVAVDAREADVANARPRRLLTIMRQNA